MRAAVLVTRLAIGGGVATAAYFAYRAGGGADAATPPPKAEAIGAAPEAKASQDVANAKGGEAYEVKLRLHEMLEDARLELPSLAAAQPFVKAYWRKVAGPWTHPSGVAAQLPMSVALLMSKMELQYAVPLGAGKTWVPDARVWNMNESSYDQRESIFAPTPATIGFRVAIPKGAKLEYSPAILQNVQVTTVFTVSVVDAVGKEAVVSTARIQAGDAKHWFEASADLSAFAGQNVEIVLRTTTEKPSGGEKYWNPPPPPPPDGDDGDKPRRHTQQQPIPPMSLALWGNARILAKQPTQVPYNVLWVVVDALRPDVIASLHDDDSDARALASKLPPADALLPKIPGLTPSIDEIGKDGVRFMHAYSGAAWTRPGTLAMLAGARSTEVGIETYNWLLPAEQSRRYYVSDPPLLPLLLRRAGVATRGVVNNFFMTGYAAVAIDFGFESLVDHRYRTKDTDEIQASAVDWLRKNKEARFFLFCNFNSPHDPYEPPKIYRDKIPPPPGGPRDPQVRLYMAEAGKDDAAIGVLMKTLDELDLRKNTIIVVTADHGETLSQYHSGLTSLDGEAPVRFHHAMGMFEETTRIPIVMRLPGLLEGGKAIDARVRSIDIAPTILDLEGLLPSPKMSGKSMMSLVRGEETGDRDVISEGRAMRALISGKYRYIQREREAQFIAGYGRVPEEVFDLETDPGERHSLHRERPELAAEMKAKLESALLGATPPKPPALSAVVDKDKPTIHLRFAGAGQARKIGGTLTFGDPKHPAPATIAFDAIGVSKDAFRLDGTTLTFTLATSAESLVGIDLHVDPPTLPVAWQLELDDKPWPDSLVFAGPFGLAATAARLGLTTDDARAETYSPQIPEIDLDRDLGVFITRDRRVEATGPVIGSDEAAKEMGAMLKDWGYAHGSSKKKKK